MDRTTKWISKILGMPRFQGATMDEVAGKLYSRSYELQERRITRKQAGKDLSPMRWMRSRWVDEQYEILARAMDGTCGIGYPLGGYSWKYSGGRQSLPLCLE